MNHGVSRRLFPGVEEVQLQDGLALLLLARGGEACCLWAEDTYEPLADVFNIEASARSVLRSECLGDGRDEPYWHTIVQFARERLVEKGDLHPFQWRGLWRLTEKGMRRAGIARTSSFGDQCLSSFARYNFKLVPAWKLKSPKELLEELLAL